LLGAIDGTTIPVYRAPTLDRHVWVTRSSEFAIGATGVCDHQGAFIFFSTGYPGSRHDSAAFKDTDLYRHAQQYLTGEEYIVGDAAYALSPRLIVGFKGTLTPDQTMFNMRLSGAQTKVVYAFGLLKGRFASLKKLRVHIADDNSLHQVSMHIAACVVLHNILVRSGLEDPFDNEFRRQVVRRNGATLESVESTEDTEENDGHEEEWSEEFFTPAQLRRMREQGIRKHLEYWLTVNE